MGDAKTADGAAELLALYDVAPPQVYGYLIRRCRDRGVAEELTSETFLAAVGVVRHRGSPTVDVGWLVGVARHKLADHWRALARERRHLLGRTLHATEALLVRARRDSRAVYEREEGVDD